MIVMAVDSLQLNDLVGGTRVESSRGRDCGTGSVCDGWAVDSQFMSESWGLCCTAALRLAADATFMRESWWCQGRGQDRRCVAAARHASGCGPVRASASSCAVPSPRARGRPASPLFPPQPRCPPPRTFARPLPKRNKFTDTWQQSSRHIMQDFTSLAKPSRWNLDCCQKKKAFLLQLGWGLILQFF